MMKKIVAIMVLLSAALFGQHFDAVSLGMGGNYIALSRGINAITWNPANLSLPRGNNLEINIFSMNLAAYNNSLAIREYNRYFTEEGHKGRWSEADKKDILNMISDDGLRTYLNFHTNILGVAYKNFGFSFQSVTQGRVALSENKKPFQILLQGEEFTKNYELKNSKLVDIDAFTAFKISMGYAYPFTIKEYIPGIDKIYVGANFNYYMGGALVETRRSDGLIRRQLTVDDEDVLQYDLNLIGRTSHIENSFPAGNGFSFDIGASTSYRKNWLISWSFSNLFGNIYWSKNTEKHILSQRDSLLIEDLFEDREEDTSVSTDTSMAIGGFSTRLPVHMRIGAAYLLREDLRLTLDWQQGFDTYFGNTSTPIVGLGAEYQPLNWLPLRAGMSLGGNHGFLFGLGFGVHVSFFQLDYSYAMNNGLWPTYSNGFFTALSMRLRF